MSGRSRITLPDGRLVTGFRKTLKQRTRTPPHLLPDWEVSCVMPLTFEPISFTGKSKAWVLEQLVQTLRLTFPEGLVNPLDVRLRREADKDHPPYNKLHSIEYDGRSVRFIDGCSIREIA